MPSTVIDGIETAYEVVGSGPPLLLFSPGGFDAKRGNWSTHGIYARTGMLDALAQRFSCITFDRRESGESGGRVERVTWQHYAEQGCGLLDRLGIPAAHVMGGCVGASVAATFAVLHPSRTRSMVLYSPAGGARYRMTQHDRFTRHLAFVAEDGLEGVVALAGMVDGGFSTEPRVGPWCTLLRRDPSFATEYAKLDPATYRTVVTGLVRTMFDRDSVPGPEPEDLLTLNVPTLVVPGRDPSHATSAARFLEECIPGARYWDAPPAEQTAETAPRTVIDFLES